MSPTAGDPRKAPQRAVPRRQGKSRGLQSAATSTHWRWRRTAGGMLLIAVVSILIYLPAMQGGFVWDDDVFLTENPLIHADDGLYRFWLTTAAPDYFPLTSTSLWLEWRLWGMAPFGYHLVNVLLHILSAILFWRVLERLKIPGAFLSGLIFAVHPVCVESVAWITERKNVLPMPLYLASVLYFLRFEANGRKADYAGSLASFALALLAKTAVVMEPVILLACAWWQRGRILGRDLKRTLPFFVLSLLLGLTTVWFQYQRAIGDVVIRTDGLASRLAVAGRAFWFYLAKALVPIHLSFVYPRWETDPSDPAAYLPLFFMAALLGLCVYYRDRWGRPLLFGLGSFAVMLFPVLGFFNIYFMKYSLVADHWQYPALPAVIALATGLGVVGYRRLPDSLHWPVAGIVVGTLSLLGVSSWKLSHNYRDASTLWLATLETNPTCWICHDNLGVILGKKGDLKEAVAHLNAALAIKPDNEKALNSLGNALMLLKQPSEAAKRYAEAVRLQPDYAIARYGLGTVLLELRRPTEAAEQLATALRLDPNHAKSHLFYSLAVLYQNHFAEAADHCREALRIDPHLTEARALLDRIEGQRAPHGGMPPGAPRR